MQTINNLKVKIFADGADKAGMLEMYRKPYIKGFTTNPTLMRAAGVADYAGFAHAVLRAIPDRPVSFEVFSDEFAEMEREARLIATWGPNVYVKIPVTNTRGASSVPLIGRLAADGLRLNITAVLTVAQVERVMEALSPTVESIVSVFAGRIADTGRDPVPCMQECLMLVKGNPRAELLWASPREVLNIFQADAIGCHIITATPPILAKLAMGGMDLDALSLETVRMFHTDAQKAGYRL